MKLKTRTNQTNQPDHDQLPRFAIGHLSMVATDVSSLADFYAKIGMRSVVDMGRMAILELRGGTHLILQSGQGGTSSLDLMVDDIDDAHAALEAAGANPNAITRGNPHDRFVATDPEGNTLVVSSSHAQGLV